MLSLSTVLAYRTDIPLLAGSLSTASAAFHRSGSHLPAAFSPAGRSFLTTNPTQVHKKNQKFIIFATIRTFFSFFFSSVSYLSFQNEQIFNCICTKESDSASSKVSLGKGPTPVIIHSAFSTLSISSPIHTRSPISFSSSQCTRSGHTHQRWC